MPRNGPERVPRAVGVAWVITELANLLDAISTWIVVISYGGTEQGPEMAPLVKAWGAAKGILVGKGIFALLVLGVALAATDIPPQRWRVSRQSRWWVIGGLWAGAAVWGYGAAHNFLLKR